MAAASHIQCLRFAAEPIFRFVGDTSSWLHCRWTASARNIQSKSQDSGLVWTGRLHGFALSHIHLYIIWGAKYKPCACLHCSMMIGWCGGCCICKHYLQYHTLLWAEPQKYYRIFPTIRRTIRMYLIRIHSIRFNSLYSVHSLRHTDSHPPSYGPKNTIRCGGGQMSADHIHQCKMCNDCIVVHYSL